MGTQTCVIKDTKINLLELQGAPGDSTEQWEIRCTRCGWMSGGRATSKKFAEAIANRHTLNMEGPHPQPRT